ncbi:hypothetical protein AA0111_g9808 [Alternaria arborescens]|uniref:hypothetical protein n=1 Tax=Alternaria arborescens TaxID=156630 RepID=UPI001074A1C9|nr:hypothetical protein AA0111_g9808 [Alternaria arborescens]RYO21208.1 hypothetical protein AA0111_g9808 [Alternaria arborescens]
MPLPIAADDETIITSETNILDIIPTVTALQPSDVSIELFCIKLRRLSSRVHTAFYTSRKSHSSSTAVGTRTPALRSIGNVYSSLSQFDSKLHAIRASAPVFSEPRCLYERYEWHDFMYEKDRLLLARGAMHNLPAQQFSGASILKEILRACYMSATRTIELYANLRSKDAITWTSSYFQIIFTAGLTVIYRVILDVLTDNHGLSATHTDPLRTLHICGSLLDFFKVKMPDAGSFATVFNVMKEEFVKDRFAHLLPSSANVAAAPTSQHRQQLSGHLSNPEVFPGHSVNENPLHSGIGTVDGHYLLSVDKQQQQTTAVAISLRDLPDITTAQFPQELTIGLTHDLMNQLESGLGEYAWGSLNPQMNCWNLLGYE